MHGTRTILSYRYHIVHFFLWMSLFISVKKNWKLRIRLKIKTNNYCRLFLTWPVLSFDQELLNMHVTDGLLHVSFRFLKWSCQDTFVLRYFILVITSWTPNSLTTMQCRKKYRLIIIYFPFRVLNKVFHEWSSKANEKEILFKLKK